jgi:Protein of unknown function (DUF664)
MPALPATSAEDVVNQPARAQFEAFLDEHAVSSIAPWTGWLKSKRQSLVSSRTTLPGLVKHATFVDKAWFDEAVSCRSRAEIGIPAASGESFSLQDGDTIASVRHAHREACESSPRRPVSPPCPRRYGSGTMPCAPRGNVARVSSGMFRCAETSLGGRWLSQLASETSS